MKWQPSEDQIDRYAYGYCMYLADAFAALMPGHIEALIDPAAYIRHAWFVDEAGKAWDIDGRRERKQVLAEHGSSDAELRQFSSQQMWTWIDNGPDANIASQAQLVAAAIVTAETEKKE